MGLCLVFGLYIRVGFMLIMVGLDYESPYWTGPIGL